MTAGTGQTPTMSEALVEEDPGWIDPDDMTAILTILDGIAVSAEPTRPETPETADTWTLCVHWLQRGPVSADTEAVLPVALTRIREHFSTRGRTPPAQLELRGPDHEVLLTVPAGVPAP